MKIVRTRCLCRGPLRLCEKHRARCRPNPWLSTVVSEVSPGAPCRVCWTRTSVGNSNKCLVAVLFGHSGQRWPDDLGARACMSPASFLAEAFCYPPLFCWGRCRIVSILCMWPGAYCGSVFVCLFICLSLSRPCLVVSGSRFPPHFSLPRSVCLAGYVSYYLCVGVPPPPPPPPLNSAGEFVLTTPSLAFLPTDTCTLNARWPPVDKGCRGRSTPLEMNNAHLHNRSERGQ